MPKITPDRAKFYKLMDDGVPRRDALWASGYRPKTDDSARAIGNHLLRHRAQWESKHKGVVSHDGRGRPKVQAMYGRKPEDLKSLGLGLTGAEDALVTGMYMSGEVSLEDVRQEYTLRPAGIPPGDPRWTPWCYRCDAWPCQCVKCPPLCPHCGRRATECPGAKDLSQCVRLPILRMR